MRAVRSVRTRRYILLELLISLTLITMCAIPLIAPHFLLQREEVRRFEEIALIPHADNAFAAVKEKFYDYRMNNIYWPRKDKKVFAKGTLDMVVLPTLGRGSQWNTRYQVTFLEQGQKNDRRYRILQVAITFSNNEREYEYLYHLYVWRKGDPVKGTGNASPGGSS